MNLDWLLGFIEGEGCFSIGFHTGASTTYAVLVSPHFSMSQKFNGALEEIQNFFHSRDIACPINASRTENFVMSINGISGCQKLAELLAPLKWHTRKRDDFETWLKCIEIIKRGEHLTKDGVLKLWDLSKNMNPGGRGKGRKKSDEELIATMNDPKLKERVRERYRRYYRRRIQDPNYDRERERERWRLQKRKARTKHEDSVH